MSLILPTNARGPILELSLPKDEEAVSVAVRNVTNGKSLLLNLPAKWNGDDLTLDFEKRTIVDQTGADRSALLDPTDNTLWTATPLSGGPNSVQVEVLGPLESTGDKSPAKVENDASVGAVAWTSPGNAKAADGAYASATEATAAQITNYLKATEFAPGVPAGAVIAGVRAEVKLRQLVATVCDYRVRLIKAGVIQGAADRARPEAENWPAEPAYIPYGGSTDLWGQGWVAGDFGTTFGLAFAGKGKVSHNLGDAAQVDHMRINVFYRRKVAYAAKATLRWVKAYY